jgi:hypothetical protein
LKGGSFVGHRLDTIRQNRAARLCSLIREFVTLCLLATVPTKRRYRKRTYRACLELA